MYFLYLHVHLFLSSSIPLTCSSSLLLLPFLQLQQQGILKSDDLITRFFRISVEMCVDLCYRTLNDPVSSTPPHIHYYVHHTQYAVMC